VTDSALAGIFEEVDRRLSPAEIDGLKSYERMPSGDPARYPAVVAYDDGDSPIENENGSTALSLRLSVEGYVEGHGGAATHDAMLKLHAQAVAALCADGSNLGGLVENIEIVGQRRVVVAQLAAKRRVGFSQDFEITFSTERGNPAKFA
jgi:hypothetical protein